jgi:gliding motility-associated lipoprotein GldH
MEAMNKWSKLLSLALLPFLISCMEDRVFEEFHSFKSNSWHEKDSVAFDLIDLDQLTGKKLIGIRFNETYPFSNFFIRIISEDSLGLVLDNKLLNIPLFDSKNGKPKGSGFGNTFTFYDTLPFDLSENTKRLIFLQYMRQDNLPGIEAVGLKILN